VTGSHTSSLPGASSVRHPGRRGFTLIELLIVVVIIGILAALAIPKFSNTKEKATLSQVKSDLRNLMTSQEAYFNDHQEYYDGAIPAAGLIFAPSTGVTVTMSEVTPGGWSATATSTGSTKSCAIFVGDAAPVGAATAPGAVACDP
jgi:type IV pilus assembly protein PilA